MKCPDCRVSLLLVGFGQDTAHSYRSYQCSQCGARFRLPEKDGKFGDLVKVEPALFRSSR